MLLPFTAESRLEHIKSVLPCKLSLSDVSCAALLHASHITPPYPTLNERCSESPSTPQQPRPADYPLYRCFNLCLTVCLTACPSCCLCPCLTPQAFTTTLLHAWFSRKFAVGCAILFPVAVTVYVTW